jgi:glycosyltransferase involved in cell wall biosynthesis
VRIAVVIPAFNVALFLAGAIQSVMDQTHTDWSLLVVDDGSSDATAAVAAQFRDPRIRLIRQDHAGVSAARNRGVQASARLRPDAFLFLDGDDWLAPDAMAQLAEILGRAPRAVAACGRYVRLTERGGRSLSPAPPEGYLLERLLIRNLFANGGHLLIRREAIETAGDFNRDLSYGEDWEYWTRLALLGEFVAVRSRTPILFVRDRAGSSMRTHAADPAAYRPAVELIHHNAAILERIGALRLADLRRRGEAENAWTVGRALIRQGRYRSGQRWLRRSVRHAPSARRVVLIGLMLLRFGPFRPFETTAGTPLFRRYRL